MNITIYAQNWLTALAFNQRALCQYNYSVVFYFHYHKTDVLLILKNSARAMI